MHYDELSLTKISKFVINTLDKTLTNLSTLKAFNHTLQNHEMVYKPLNLLHIVISLFKITFPLGLHHETQPVLSHIQQRRRFSYLNECYMEESMGLVCPNTE